MSTRSRIGFEAETGTVYSVYCHCDGYLEYNGRILVENYGTLEKARQLVSLGSISSLGRNWEYRTDENPEGTKDYFRWRGEESEPTMDFNKEDYARNGFDCDEEFIYLFMNGEWFYMTRTMDCWRMVRDSLGIPQQAVASSLAKREEFFKSIINRHFFTEIGEDGWLGFGDYEYKRFGNEKYTIVLKCYIDGEQAFSLKSYEDLFVYFIDMFDDWLYDNFWDGFRSWTTLTVNDLCMIREAGYHLPYFEKKLKELLGKENA